MVWQGLKPLIDKAHTLAECHKHVSLAHLTIKVYVDGAVSIASHHAELAYFKKKNDNWLKNVNKSI